MDNYHENSYIRDIEQDELERQEIFEIFIGYSNRL